MRFEQTRDVLEHVRKFHLEISDLYHRLSEQSEKQRLRMLLEYMSEREKQLARALSQFEEESSRNVLDTWFQYTHDEERLQCPDFKLTPETSVDDVMRLGMKLAECFIELYREIAGTADSNEVRDVFRNLLERENREKLKLARNAQLLDDL
jgi:rubrerythrin